MVEHYISAGILKKTADRIRYNLRGKRGKLLTKLMPTLFPREKIDIPIDENKIELGRELREWLSANKTILIFEPHSDDTALSMGDFFSQLSDEAKKLTYHATVFSKGREIGQIEGFPSVDACYLKRRSEAETAYTSLGIPKNNLSFLGEVDFLYRRFKHTSLIARMLRPTELLSTVLGYTEMFLPFISPRDRKLLRVLTEQFRSKIAAYENPVCFIPLGGNGRHIDHYIVRVALERAVHLFPPDQQEHIVIIYYDDWPYNLRSPIKLPPGTDVVQHSVNHEFKETLFNIFETQKNVVYPGGMPPNLPPEQFIISHYVAQHIKEECVLPTCFNDNSTLHPFD